MRNGLLLCALIASLLVPRGALAHGGLPVSTQIQWRGETMYVPATYWGVFVGTDGGPLKWICDEAINGNLLRQVYQSGDGTLYATDLAGLTLSRDGGCDWSAVSGGLSMLTIDVVAPDPTKPARLYAMSGLGGLWRTDDSGKTFQQLAAAPALLLRGLLIGTDGQITLVATKTGIMQVPMLFASTDDGTSFPPIGPISPIPDGVPSERVTLLALDPRSPQTAYARFGLQGDSPQVLVRLNLKTGAASEVLRLDNMIFSVDVDMQHDRLLIATASGLYYADGSAAPVRSPGLSRAQCTSVHEGKTYACSWNYAPDLAAVARSEDGGQSFKKVFQYADAVSIMDCPAQSSVARICPSSWLVYAPQLGIHVTTVQGMDMGGHAPAPMGGGCSAVRHPGTPWSAAALALGLLALIMMRRVRSG